MEKQLKLRNRVTVEQKKKIAELYKDGYNSCQIASVVCLPSGTVSHHYKKLVTIGTKSRVYKLPDTTSKQFKLEDVLVKTVSLKGASDDDKGKQTTIKVTLKKEVDFKELFLKAVAQLERLGHSFEL